jgi:hypothetical protein
VGGEREMLDWQVTDQRLDVGVVLTMLALRLRDGRDIRDESVEKSPLPSGSPPCCRSIMAFQIVRASS